MDKLEKILAFITALGALILSTVELVTAEDIVVVLISGAVGIFSIFVIAYMVLHPDMFD